MKIEKIKINSFGKLENKEYNLSENINLIYGKNEAGKSTLLKFIQNTFYGTSKNKKGKTFSDYDLYKPWNDGDFSGKIKYKLDSGEEYEVYREFGKKSPKIYNNKLEDITILTTNENTGVDIVKFFMNKGIKVSHVYDMNKKKNEKNRRNEKWKFRGGTGRLKICSYHSYKGWQTPNIILVLDSCGSENIVDIRKNVGNAIFISMSRVKPNSMNGQFSFTCFNYLPEYNFLEKLF